MKKKGVIIGVIIAVIVIIAVSIIGSYNGLISLEESTNTAYSDIQVQLQRRMDLVPNLVNTVKGYAAHETEVFTAVSDARAKLAGAGTVEEASEANEELSSALSRLIAISESYPELKSNENFLSLQDELAGTENRIGVARKDY
ncbi:MAG: LemA family protein, partial [Hominilimicola sp.]